MPVELIDELSRFRVMTTGLRRGHDFTVSPLDKPENKRCDITGGLFANNLANTIIPSTNQDRFLTEGGVFVSNGQPNDYPLKSATVAVGNIGVTNAYSTYNAIEFMTTSSQVMFKFYVGGGSSQYSAFRVVVDGECVNKNSQTILSLTGQAPGVSNFIKLDFSGYGGSGVVRNIRFEWDNGVNMSIISYSDGDVWSVPERPRVCFFGDSFFAYGSGATAAEPTYVTENVAVRIARKMGWSPTCCAVGGTGYVNNGGSNYAWNSAQRLADLSLKPFDAFVFLSSVNDGSATASAITNSAVQVFTAARAARPTAPIYVLGVLNGQAVTTLPAASIENAVKAAVDEIADKNTVFIPSTTDPSGSWITASNKTHFVDADGVHLRAKIGEEYIASRAAAELYRLLGAR